MAFGVLASPFVLGLILILQNEVTHPSPQVRGVGRRRAEPFAPTLLPPRAALSEVQGSPHHMIFSWAAGLFSSVALLGPRRFAWPWKKVQCKLQVDVNWKSTP